MAGINDKKELKRPGGALASRPLNFFWIVDCSGSMYGEKIGTVNNAIQQTIPEMRSAAEDNPNAQLLIRTLAFSDGANWLTTSPVPIENFVWSDLEADGCTALGQAFDLLAAQLDVSQLGTRALPPVLVLLSDGIPTDDWKKPLEHLQQLPWGKKAVKIAISIGNDADDDVLTAFTGNRELVLQANNAPMLTKMIKWASTVASVVSAPASRATSQQQSGAPISNVSVILDMDNIPDSSDIDANDVW